MHQANREALRRAIRAPPRQPSCGGPGLNHEYQPGEQPTCAALTIAPHAFSDRHGSAPTVSRRGLFAARLGLHPGSSAAPTPVPEPSSLRMLATGLIITAVAARRKKRH